MSLNCFMIIMLANKIEKIFGNVYNFTLFLESSHDDDQNLVPYNKNLKNGSYSHSRQEAPDLSLALASAIEFITSKLTGTNAYLVKESTWLI
jgi:hypothetical protein